MKSNLDIEVKTTMEVDGVHLFVNEELVLHHRQRSRRPSDENPFGWIFGD